MTFDELSEMLNGGKRGEDNSAALMLADAEARREAAGERENPAVAAFAALVESQKRGASADTAEALETLRRLGWHVTHRGW